MPGTANAYRFFAIGPLAALLAAAHAQVVVPSGKTPAQAQRPAIAQHCVSCHGEYGEGGRSPGAPRIAGQSAHYIEKQLQSYANGSRRNPMMEAMAKAMSPQDMGAFAAYYAKRDAPVARHAGATDGAVAELAHGRMLATMGNPAGQVQACINCHGPGGVGLPPTIPYLAGLDYGYLVAALYAWKAGTRNNDAGQQMASLVERMTATDVTAVARYYASLPPPPPARSAISMNRPARGEAARGRAIVASGVHGCTACHAIPGIRGPRGVVGPSLDGLARRSFLAGQLPNNTEVLVAFLRNPAALVPQTGMPDVGLSDQEARDIAAFLFTLEPSHGR